ncbi:hypothetical protein [Kitasatospora sp. NPDC057500]|uniref:hypothetical protein n=1 Tax=Kitasatospora sp. NPDC057500 TaxID=3346151 RepID=UPI0036BE59B2
MTDQRQFSLVDYRHGHPYAVIRGFPAMDDDAPGSYSARVLDLPYTAVSPLASGDPEYREANAAVGGVVRHSG